MYLKILLPTHEYFSLDVSINLEIRLATNIMYGLVAMRYVRLLTNLLKNVGYTFEPLSYLSSFALVVTGVGVALQFMVPNIFNVSNASFVQHLKTLESN